jgi:hypothetical protein
VFENVKFSGVPEVPGGQVYRSAGQRVGSYKFEGMYFKPYKRHKFI